MGAAPSLRDSDQNETETCEHEGRACCIIHAVMAHLPEDQGWKCHEIVTSKKSYRREITK
jgi:hypothetical protein